MKIKQLFDLIQDIHTRYGTSQPYLCGGLPRDKYLNKMTSLADIDITTGDMSIKKLFNSCYQELDKKFHIKMDTKSDGHSTIYFRNLKIDFSSNFIDPYAKKFLISKNIKPNSLLLESFSRDFRCNSMLMTMDFNNIIDPIGKGKKDCDNKIIKTILPPQVAFKSDIQSKNNRIIRSVYLAAKLDFTIDDSIVDYIKNNPGLITLTSPKTLIKKLNSAYAANPDKTKYYMKKMNLWKFVPINEMLSEEILELLTNPKVSL